jgi:hypothetical protein
MKRKLILVIAVLFLSAALSLLKASHSDAYLMKENAEALDPSVYVVTDNCYNVLAEAPPTYPSLFYRRCDDCKLYRVLFMEDKKKCVVSYIY